MEDRCRSSCGECAVDLRLEHPIAQRARRDRGPTSSMPRVLAWRSKLVLARLHKKIGEADFFLRKMREQELRIIGDTIDKKTAAHAGGAIPLRSTSIFPGTQIFGFGGTQSADQCRSQHR